MELTSSKGMAHVVHEDDIYQGYLIPKGAIILPNIWYDCTTLRVNIEITNSTSCHSRTGVRQVDDP